jgi:hypothetical protein
MPLGAVVMHVARMRGHIRIWAVVDEDEKTMVERFFCVNTGSDPVENSAKHIGTVVNNAEVWHVFEMASNLTAKAVTE